MMLLAAVTIGIPSVFLAIRLILHAVDPHTYGPAGGYDIYVGLVGRRAVRVRLHRGGHARVRPPVRST